MRRNREFRVIFDGVPVGEVPDRRRKPGELFSRLVGVMVSSDGNYIEPLYIPLVRWRCQAGQVFIEINSYSRPLAYITLQRRKPFLSIYRFPWRLLDEDEP